MGQSTEETFPPPPPATTVKGAPLDEIINHDLFFQPDLHFQVDGHRFKAPRMLFENESVAFREMFLLPTGPDDTGTSEGSTSENPIIFDPISGVTHEEFSSLLILLYPIHKDKELSVENWKGVLRLSDMWGFRKIYRTANNKLNKLLKDDPATRLQLARIHNLDAKVWHIPALKQLIERKESLSVEEMMAIGLETTATIMSMRDSANPKKTAQANCPNCSYKLSNSDSGTLNTTEKSISDRFHIAID